MATDSGDIETSLEVREILMLEVQTLSKDTDALDVEIVDLRRKKEELEERIETQKHRLVSGTRHLKNLNLQRLQAEYETQDIQDQMDQTAKTFDSRASVYGKLEVEALRLEREVQWKREDLEEWRAKREAKRWEEEEKLRPKAEERDALRRELESVEEKIHSLEVESESVDKDIDAKQKAEVDRLRREIRVLENRNEAHRKRMRRDFDDLSAKLVITRQKMGRERFNNRK